MQGTHISILKLNTQHENKGENEQNATIHSDSHDMHGQHLQ